MLNKLKFEPKYRLDITTLILMVLGLLIAGLVLAAIIGRGFAKGVKATQTHKEWSEWKTVEEGVCKSVPIDGICNSNKGLQTIIEKRECLTVAGSGQDECDTTIYLDCPNGYIVRPLNHTECRKLSSPFNTIERPHENIPSEETRENLVSCETNETRECKDENKQVNIFEKCDGSATVIIYGGKTRRTWRVNGVEKWIDFYQTETWENVPTNSIIEWWHESSKSWTPADDGEEGYVVRHEATDCSRSSNDDNHDDHHEPSAPVCSDGNTLKLPENLHVLRAGSQAVVNFFITEGDSANIYWRELNQSEWQHSSAATDSEGVKPNTDNFVSYEVNDLDPNLGYVFGVEQKWGCGGGNLATAIVVDGPKPRLFPFSYWEWSKQ